MRAGIEDKRKVYALAVLTAVTLFLTFWVFHGASAPPSSPTAHIPAHSAMPARHANTPARGQEDSNLQLKLHIGDLAHIEQIVYSSTGRNIFSLESEPPKVETPLAPVRPDPATTPQLQHPDLPKVPVIDVKYLGYTQSSDKIYNAILYLGNDSLTAKTGEIVFHRYKVGVIRPTSVQVTDLSMNNTYTLILTDK